MTIGELTREKMDAPMKGDTSRFLQKESEWDEGFYIAEYSTDWDMGTEIHGPLISDDETPNDRLFPPEAFVRVLDIRFRYLDGADIFHVEFCMN